VTASTVALTGGIGSGKSTACRMFADLGVPVIDADEIARGVTRAGGPAFQGVVDLVGPAAVGPDGELRREFVRDAVFGSEPLRRAVEALIHPLVYAEIRKRIEGLSTPYCVVCVPLLLESGMASGFDRVLVVDAPEDLQIRRASERDSVPADAIRKIIGSQSGRDARLRAAHDVIRNDGGLDQLRAQVERLHRGYLGRTENRVAGPA
jgi:dephospho-CoA kinase